MNWFKRHLNWTVILAAIGAYAIVIGLALLSPPDTPEGVFDFFTLFIMAVVILPVSAWALIQKGRRLWWLLVYLIPYVGWVFFLILENYGYLTKTDNEIRGKCLDYFIQEARFKSIQSKASDSYNTALLKYRNSLQFDGYAATEMCQVSANQAQSANDILEARSNISTVPDEVAHIYFLWQIAYQDYAAWATSQSAAIEAIAGGMNPVIERVQGLFRQANKSQDKAQKEEVKFLKRLKVNAAEFQNILNIATPTLKVDNHV